jgi:aldehyde dehydrogenase
MNPAASSHQQEAGYQSEYGHFIGGEWINASTNRTIDLLNPATGDKLATIQAGSGVDAVRAVAAAKNAFPKWSQTSAQQRQELLIEFVRRLKARTRKYGLLETLITARRSPRRSILISR